MSSSIREALKTARPALSDSSLNTYTSILSTLHKAVFGSTIDVSNFKKVDAIVDYVKDIPPNKIKTTLSALVVLTDDKKFRDIMLDKIQDYTKTINGQEKTDKQSDAWITKSDIDNKMVELKRTATYLYKKDKLNIDDLQKYSSI